VQFIHSKISYLGLAVRVEGGVSGWLGRQSNRYYSLPRRGIILGCLPRVLDLQNVLETKTNCPEGEKKRKTLRRTPTP